LEVAGNVLEKNSISYHQGNFITVMSVSGTRQRGSLLQQKYNGLCENMEGASLARVCHEFRKPFVELRSISNYVEDRDLSRWNLEKACENAAYVASLVINELEKNQ